MGYKLDHIAGKVLYFDFIILHRPGAAMVYEEGNKNAAVNEH